MAATVGSLLVTLDADLTAFVSGLNAGQRQLNQFGSLADRNARGAEVSVSRLMDAYKSRTQVVTQSIGSLGTALGTLGVGVSMGATIKRVSAAAREYIDLQNALKVTGLEGAALEKTFNSLFQIAQKNGTAIAPLVTLFSRASQAQKELNASSADLLRFTDGVSTALRVAGTNSTQAAGALLQLSQAIGGGVVRAEEFNSVNEGARPILQAVAAGLEEASGSVSKLKTLVNEGKISSEAFFRAFLAGMPQLEAQAAKADVTIGQASARISNAFTMLIGKLDETAGISKNTAANLMALGGVLENLPGYFEAATKRLETFQSYLTQLGNSSVWMKIARAFDADLSEDGVRQAGLTLVRPPSSAGGRIAEGARDPLGRALATPTIKPVPLRDFKVPGKKDDGKTADPFERSTAMIQKRVELLNSEAATMDLGTAARERARVVIELETAARRANEAAGLKNTDVTEAQRAKIDELADAYAKAATNVEAMNSPLSRLARSSADANQQFQNLAVTSLDSLTDDLADVVMKTQTVEEAFKKMADAIIKDLIRIAIRQAIVAPIAGALGGMFGGGMFGGGMSGASSPVSMFGGAGANFPVPTFDSGGIAGVTGFGPKTRIGSLSIADSGLGPRHFLSILEKGEAVLTRDLTNRTASTLNGLSNMPLTGDGGGGLQVTVIEAPGGDKASVSQTPDGNVQVKMTRQMDDTMSALILSGESRTNAAMQRRYGVDPTRGMT